MREKVEPLEETVEHSKRGKETGEKTVCVCNSEHLFVSFFMFVKSGTESVP